MITLREQLKDIEVSFIGNRVTALGLGFAASGLLGLFNTNQDNFAVSGSFALLNTLGYILCYETALGRKTSEVYNFTMKHIANKGRIDEQFVERVLNPQEYGRIYGYCEQQGVYLALRDAGMKEDFKLVKERSRNIIPNF